MVLFIAITHGNGKGDKKLYSYDKKVPGCKQCNHDKTITEKKTQTKSSHNKK